MRSIPLYIIRDELKRHYQTFGTCITMRMAVEAVAKNPDNFTDIRQFPYPDNVESLTDEEFFQCYFYEHYLYFEKNDADYLLYKAESIFQNQHLVHCFLHENYADQKMHFHDFYEITYAYHGQCKMNFTSESIMIHEGNVCIIPPNVTHEPIVRDDTSFIVNLAITRSAFEACMSCILLRKDAIALYIQNILYNPGSASYLFVPSENSTIMKNAIRHICSESIEKNYYAFSNRISWLSVFVCAFFGQHTALTPKMSSFSQEQLKKLHLMEYIQMNYRTATLETTAKYFNYNKSYLSRHIRQLTGKTFIEIITDLKLQEGKYLLENTDFSLNVIADQIGYNTGDYFSKIFKSKYHLSAAEYRTQKKKEL